MAGALIGLLHPAASSAKQQKTLAIRVARLKWCGILGGRTRKPVSQVRASIDGDIGEGWLHVEDVAIGECAIGRVVVAAG